MKHKLLIGLLFVLLCIPVFAYAQQAVTLRVNSKNITTDSPPIIINDRTLIPARAVFEELGAQITWDQPAYQVVVVYQDTEIVLKIGDVNAAVNGKNVKLDVPAMIVNERTMIPVRFVAEALDFEVQWDPKNYIVNIVAPEPKPVHTHTISTITFTQTDTQNIVRVSGVGDLTPKTMKLTGPDRLVFDFQDTKMNAQTQSLKGDGSVIQSVRFSQYSAAVARVVLDLAESGATYTTQNDHGDLLILFARKNGTNPGKPEEPGTTAPTKDPSSYVSPYKLSAKAKGKLVVIDPGHGGSEVGTVGNHNGKEIYEKGLNLDISLKLNQMLKNNGVSTYMIRTDDTYVDIMDRPVIGNQKNGYMFLCIHNNSNTNASVSGVQIYYSDSTPSYDSMTNKEFGKFFYDEIAKQTGLRQAGMVDNPRYIVIYKSNMPAIIVENAFVSNPGDLEKLLNDDFRTQLAQAICDATIQALNKSVE